MDEPIMISVIIPTYNRCQLLKECLESLGRQTYPLSDIEVMVVNDGSTDGTEAFLEDFKTRAPFQFRYFRQQNKGPAAARNLALQNAKGNLIAFTDDDCTVDPDWLKEFAKGFQEKRIAGYGGAVRPKEDHLIGEYMTRERSLEPKEIERCDLFAHRPPGRSGRTMSKFAYCGFSSHRVKSSQFTSE